MLIWRISLIKRLAWFVGLLTLVGLACNAPIGGETPSPPPPATSAETDQPAPTITQSPTVEPATAESATAELPTAETEPTTEIEATVTLRPTFTPIQTTAPADATATEPATPTKMATAAATITTTPTKAANSGPLSFTYSIGWEVSSNPAVAIATVTINAVGGGGDYEYFRDDLPVDGPVFQYQWATCRANPGSLRVDSADGQSVRMNYFETPPCPESS